MDDQYHGWFSAEDTDMLLDDELIDMLIDWKVVVLKSVKVLCSPELKKPLDENIFQILKNERTDSILFLFCSDESHPPKLIMDNNK